MTMSRILVVDDDPSMLTLLKAGLSRWGFEVHTACQGVDAMMQFRAKAGDITAIVTDIDMPRMGGLDFVRAVRDAGFQGRIIVMSGRMTPDELSAFQGFRVNGFFSKPFDISLLATMLSRPAELADDLT
jgi:two-component system, cell cycle sensor histidine kinase and response regulator CckA